jgi:hypothetical protein
MEQGIWKLPTAGSRRQPAQSPAAASAASAAPPFHVAVTEAETNDVLYSAAADDRLLRECKLGAAGTKPVCSFVVDSSHNDAAMNTSMSLAGDKIMHVSIE